MTGTPVAIRPAERGDLHGILRVFAEDELKGGPFREPSEAQLEAFEAIAADPNNGVYVAEVDGAVVGTFQLTFIRQLSYGGCLVAQIESVHVLASERSQGVGSAMMRAARAEAERRGAFRLQLTSDVRRQRAHRFYERLGFRATHTGMKLYLEPPAARGRAEY